MTLNCLPPALLRFPMNSAPLNLIWFDLIWFLLYLTASSRHLLSPINSDPFPLSLLPLYLITPMDYYRLKHYRRYQIILYYIMAPSMICVLVGKLKLLLTTNFLNPYMMQMILAYIIALLMRMSTINGAFRPFQIYGIRAMTFQLLKVITWDTSIKMRQTTCLHVAITESYNNVTNFCLIMPNFEQKKRRLET